MYFNKLNDLLLAAVIALGIHSSAFAANSTMSHPAVISSTECLSGPYATRDHFIQVINEFMPFDPLIVQRVVSEERFQFWQSNYNCQRFIYDVGGHEVIGYMIRKAHQDEQQPALIYHRGGNGNFGALNPWFIFNRLFSFADEGYTVFASNLRAKDEFGGADVADTQALLNIVLEMDDVNKQKIALWGESRGAGQMMQTARGRNDIHALVFSMGSADAAKGLEFRPEMAQVYRVRVPNYESQREEALRERSVIYWADELPAVPVLIIHGEKDVRVHVNQAYALAEQLEQLNHPHTLKVYPDMGHSMSDQATADMRAWLKRTLAIEN